MPTLPGPGRDALALPLGEEEREELLGEERGEVVGANDDIEVGLSARDDDVDS